MKVLIPPLPTGSEWTFEAIEQYDEAIGKVAASYRLDCYPHLLESIPAPSPFRLSRSVTRSASLLVRPSSVRASLAR